MSDPIAAGEAIQRTERDVEWHATDPCAKCGNPRTHHGNWPTYTRSIGRRQHYDLGHAFVAAVCPNEDDPVMCKVHEGVFIPEAGCPRHDPEVRS